MPKKSESNPALDDIRRTLAEEAWRLRQRAKELMSQHTRPDVDEYVKAGKGTQYQADHDVYSEMRFAVEALENAAFRIEQDGHNIPKQDVGIYKYSIGYSQRKHLIGIDGLSEPDIATIERLYDCRGSAEDVEKCAQLFESAGEHASASNLRRILAQ